MYAIYDDVILHVCKINNFVGYEIEVEAVEDVLDLGGGAVFCLQGANELRLGDVCNKILRRRGREGVRW